ncbi:MAG: hypothetical protein U5L11_03050 [Arhodomonas sp.]|nr:hypothetical protein [Arhodomonas sp.]
MIPLTFHLLAARPAGSRPAPARLGEPGTEHNSWEVYDHSGRNTYTSSGMVAGAKLFEASFGLSYTAGMIEPFDTAAAQ